MAGAEEYKSIEFYKNEVSLWRGRGSLFWGTALLPVSSYLFMTMASFSPFHPFQWLIELFLAVISVKRWFHLLFMCFLFWVVSSRQIRFFSVVPEVSSSRWSALLHLFSIGRSFHIACTAVASAVICWSLLHVLGAATKDFSQTCSNDEANLCLNEKHVFIVLHACYIGLVGSIHYFTANHNLICYPVIQQNKWNQGRSALLPTLLASALFVLHKLKFFYPLYYLLLGSVFKQWILRFVSLTLEPEPVDSIFGLLDIGLFLTTWTTGTLLHFHWAMFGVLYTAYQTEPYDFVIQTIGEMTEKRKLVVALACEKYPLLQFQGYQDLCLLAKNSGERRAELFSLSTLGGHPHNWLSVSTECLSSLQRFSDCVQSHNNLTMAGGSMKTVNGEKTAKERSGVTFRESGSGEPATQTEEKAAMKKKKESLFRKFYEEVVRAKVLGPLMSSQPEASSRQLLAHTQKYIWNVEALSHLVTASFTEDTFGVVQKSLPDIITTLVTLQEEIEKMMKLASTVTREVDSETALHTRLRAALKAAIYNIVNKFGQHLESIQVPQEIKKRLHHFSEYKV